MGTNYRWSRRGQPKKTTVDNITFNSKSEADRYLFLKSLEQQGAIKELNPKPASVELLPDRRTEWNGKLQDFRYTPDFTYVYDGHFFVEEHKPRSERYWSITLKVIEHLGVYDNFFVSKNIYSLPERKARDVQTSRRNRGDTALHSAARRKK